MQLPPPAEEVDPSTATTCQEFADCLRRLARRYGLSYADIAKASGGQISKAAIANLIGGNKLPTRRILHIFLNAFKLTPAQIVLWDSKWIELDEATFRGESQQLALRQEAAAHKVAEAEARIAALRQREDQLSRELALEREHVEKLTGDRHLADKYITLLEAQLASVRDQLRQANDDCNDLAEQLRALAAAHAAVKREHDRADVEKDFRQQAERKLEAANARIEDLEAQRSARREADTPKQRPPKPATPTTQDAPYETTIAVRDSNFGLPYDFSIQFLWYCVACGKGGSRPQVLCPHCVHAIEEHYTKTVQIKELPQEPCYGKTLRLRGQGNHDDPGLARGDLLVKVTKRPSRWGR